MIHEDVIRINKEFYAEAFQGFKKVNHKNREENWAQHRTLGNLSADAPRRLNNTSPGHF